jgi:hypothetical protein
MDDVDSGPLAAKQIELRRCHEALTRARERLDDLIARSRDAGLDDDEAEDLGPVTIEIVRLRERSERLADELDAVVAEWS